MPLPSSLFSGRNTKAAVRSTAGFPIIWWCEQMCSVLLSKLSFWVRREDAGEDSPKPHASLPSVQEL